MFFLKVLLSGVAGTTDILGTVGTMKGSMFTQLAVGFGISPVIEKFPRKLWNHDERQYVLIIWHVQKKCQTYPKA